MEELLKSQLEELNRYFMAFPNSMGHQEYFSYFQLKFDLEQKIKEIEENKKGCK